MYVACVSVFVKPGHEEDFAEATRRNHDGTRQEPGNVRFDVLQSLDDPTRFFLYEVYHDEAAFKAHQQTEHYLGWKQTVAEWMAQPRQGPKYRSLFPADDRF